MAENKEQLKLLLEFIAKILEQEGNEWFHDELAVLFSKRIMSEKDTEVRLSAVTIKEFGSIDKYIENGIIPIIDYEDIEDVSIKYTLLRDCIEMGKCRFSHFGQPQSFLDFCKYAFFQIEQLVNYYIIKKNGNSFKKSVDYIKEYNSMARTERKKKVSSIPFSDKLFAIKNQTGMKQELKGTLDKVSYARNNSLHRSPEQEDRLIDITPLFKESIKKEKTEQSSKDKEIIQDYYYLKFIADRDYSLITNSIMELKQIIVSNLNNITD